MFGDPADEWRIDWDKGIALSSLFSLHNKKAQNPKFVSSLFTPSLDSLTNLGQAIKFVVVRLWIQSEAEFHLALIGKFWKDSLIQDD